MGHEPGVPASEAALWGEVRCDPHAGPTSSFCLHDPSTPDFKTCACQLPTLASKTKPGSQDDLVVLKQVADDVQRVVGHADSETQATQVGGACARATPGVTLGDGGVPGAVVMVGW
jgi:hypothetical protein